MAFALLLLLGLLVPLFGDGFGSSDDDDDDDSDDDDTMAETQPTQDEDMADDPPETVAEDGPDTPPDEDPSQIASTEPLTTYRSGPEGGYNIDVDFEGTWTRDQQQAVIDAADYISEIVVEDVPDVAATGTDDIRISARLIDIDGPLGTAGFGGFDAARPDSLLPYSGLIELDVADADPSDPNYDDVVLHEMMHALGFGTVWTAQGLLQDDTSGQQRFIGANAVSAYDDAFPEEFAADPRSSQGVPTQGDNAHWNEAIFGDEILTPDGISGENSNISAITIASLEDLGYDTIFDDPTDPTDQVGTRPPFPIA